MVKLAELHLHTKYSSHGLYRRDAPWRKKLIVDSLLEPRTIFKRAKALGLNAVAITDHDTIAAFPQARELSREFGVVFIPGEEVTSKDGEILAYGIREVIPPGNSAEVTIKLIHDQGGVAVVAHPFLVYSLGKRFGRRGGVAVDESIIRSLPFDGIETFDIFFGQSVKIAVLAKTVKLAYVGGSDVHNVSNIGLVTTVFPKNCTTPEHYVTAMKYRRTQVVGKRLNVFSTFTKLLWAQLVGRFFVRYDSDGGKSRLG